MRRGMEIDSPKSSLINNRFAMKYPLTTDHPLNRPNADFTRQFPETPGPFRSTNIHNSPTATGPLPCDPAKRPVHWTPATQNPFSRSTLLQGRTEQMTGARPIHKSSHISGSAGASWDRSEPVNSPRRPKFRTASKPRKKPSRACG